MKKIIVFILIVFLYSQDLVDIYRTKGENAVIKAMEKRLQSSKYWLNKLKNTDVTYGYYEKTKNILLCVKEKKVLNVFSYNGGKIKKLDTINVLTGLEGDKEKEGDLKTPVGVYRLVSLLNDVDEFYGPFAFETSYPNMFDRINDKNGHGIWIHGVPLDGKRESNNTKGCIVMQNDKLRKLKNEIDYKNTYLLISEENVLTTDKNEIARVLAFIYKWRYAWKNSDFDKYKKLYSDRFRRSDGKNLKEFLEYKKRVFQSKKGQKISIFFKNINIIPYQNINGHKIFRIDMYEVYKSKNYNYSGRKELYVVVNGDIKIVAEK